MTIQEAKDEVVQEVLYLYHRGYDGPFMGEEIEPLFKSIAKLERLLIRDGKDHEDRF